MMSPASLSLWCRTFLVLLASPAFSQETHKQPKLTLVDSIFSETFTSDGTRNLRGLSSRTIVGLQLGHGNGPFKVTDIAAPVGIERGAEYCVKLTSSDARYRSLNRYQASKAAGPSELIETRSKFDIDLAKTYTSEDIAIRLTLSKLCQDDDDKVLIPVVPPGAQKTDSLIAFVNSRGSRAGISLVDSKGAVLSSGQCSPSQSDRVLTYSEICEVSIKNITNVAAVSLRVDVMGEAPQTSEVKLGAR